MTCMPPTSGSIVCLQVHASKIGHAAVQAAILALATATPARSQSGFSGSNADFLSVGGGMLNLTAGNANGFTTVTGDGRNKAVGATSGNSDPFNTTVTFQ